VARRRRSAAASPASPSRWRRRVFELSKCGGGELARRSRPSAPLDTRSEAH
jgi:hypothetical protein